MRLSTVSRSDAWMKANYNNLMKVSGFLTWGSVSPTSPSVTAVTPSDALLTDTDDSGTLTVTVDFSEAMDPTAIPTLTFSPDLVAAGILTFSGGSWTDSDTYAAVYDVAEVDGTDHDSVTIDVTGAKAVDDEAQGDWSPVQELAVDMLNPSVDTVEVSDTVLDETDLGSTFIVTVTFDEDMDEGTAPTLAFDTDLVTSGDLTDFAGGWSDSVTYTARYTVADGDTVDPAVTIDVANAKDAGGNDQQDYTALDELAIDMATSLTIVTDVTASDLLLTDADAGAGNLTVTVEFNKAMNTSVAPTLTFSSDIVTAGILELASGSWTEPEDDTYVAVYNVTAGDVDHASVTIDVTGAKDAGNGDQEDWPPEHEFEVSMVNPTVTGVSASPATVTDANLGTATFTVTVDFSEDMNQTVAPTLTFGSVVSGTLTFNAGASSWTDSDTYVAKYDVGESDEVVSDVTIDVTGAEDVNGNVQDPFDNPDTEFSIDTVNPTVTDVSVNDTSLNLDDVGAGNFVVTVTFSEAMDDATTPTLTFDPTVGSVLTFASGSWTAGDTYQAVYDVGATPTAVNNVEIDVTGAEDGNGNVQQDYTPESEFSIAATPWASGGEGGTVTHYTDLDSGQNWSAHIFTNVGVETITFTSAGLVEYLVVAGGGGGSGAAYENGGGGAGGMLTGTVYVTATSHDITVGDGGDGRLNNDGVQGDNSSIGTLVETIGGGYGDNGSNGGEGGSGGGCSSYNASTGYGGGVDGQGHDGTYGYASGSTYRGGAGGGAGASPVARSATGGIGKESSITGSAVTYARGGNGGSRNAVGDGATADDNTGNGGGGAGNTGTVTYSGGDGGSGIVVIRYPTPASGTLFLLR